MPRAEPERLPDWEPGTVAILSTGAGAPHAIPVSTGVVAGPRLVLIALARGASRWPACARIRVPRSP